MKSSPMSAVRRLRRDQFRHLHARRALCLRAERGSLWVTVDGLPDDFELDAGQSRVFERGADIVVGTLGGDAVFSATPMPEPAGWAERLRAWLSPRPLAART